MTACVTCAQTLSAEADAVIGAIAYGMEAAAMVGLAWSAAVLASSAVLRVLRWVWR